MKHQARLSSIVVGALAGGLTLTALCILPSQADAKKPIDVDIPPVRSGDYGYSGEKPGPVQLLVEDARDGARPFLWGQYEQGRTRHSFALHFKPGGDDELAYFSESLASELSKHGIAASTKAQQGAEVMKVRVEVLDMRNRVFGWSTWATHLHLRVTATYKGQQTTIGGYVVHAKSVGRGFHEEDTNILFAQPIHMAVREVAAKLNRTYWSLSVPLADVEVLIARVPEPPHGETTIRLTDVASTNNARAAKYLSTLVDHANQPTRRTALWALGLLGSSDAVEPLRKRALEGDSADMLLAIKSLQDIGTSAALAAVKEIEVARRPKLNKLVLEELDALLALYR